MEIKPEYYDEFVCVAGQCKFTCCREWKIGVDPVTKSKWKNISASEFVGVNDKMLADFVCCEEDGDRIALADNGLCPFLDSNKLCKIVLKYGETNISTTCQIFPREKHEFNDRIEYNLTMGCPAALELLWTRERFIFNDSSDRGFRYLRSKFIEMIQDTTIEMSKALQIFFYIMLDLYEKEYSEDEKVDWEIDLKSYFDKAFLEQLKTAVYDVDCDLFDKYMEQNELFLDLIDNYRNKKIYSGIIEPLAQKAEELETHKDIDGFLRSRQEFEKEFKKFDKQIRLLIAEELYSTFYLPEGDLYTSVIKLEWLGITFAALETMMFLTWLNKETLDNEDLLILTTVLIRMTGYSEADIEEYLDESFENIIWDWGYMALIV